MTTEIKYLGIDPDYTVCDCCGKRHLKHTVALDINGKVRRYGSTCAAKALRKESTKSTKTTSKDIILYSKVVSKINSLLGAGYNLKVVRDYVWRKYGINGQVKDYTLVRNDDGKVARKYIDKHIYLTIEDVDYRFYEPVVVSWWRC